MEALTRIAINLIDPNPDQPRKRFDQGAIIDLATSIEAEGLAQPITIRPIGDRYEVVMGERRWRAFVYLATNKGLDAFSTIPAHVRKMDTRQRDILAIVENCQRQDIDPMEEARAFKRLVDQGMTPAEIAAAIGVPVFRVNWRLQLLNLSPEIAKLAEAGQIDRQLATEAARLPDHASQARLIRMANSGALKGWGSIRAAVDSILDPDRQSDIFGAGAPKATDEEVRKLRGMEEKIGSVARLISGGWKDGECIVATRVNPDTASKVADQIAAIRSTLAHMERDLRSTAAQGHVALTEVSYALV